MKLTKKRLIIIISAAVLLLAAVAVLLFFLLRKEEERDVYYYGDFAYSIKEDETIEIVSYIGSATDVVVPTAIESRTVTSIGDSAFIGNKMKTLKLGAFVTKIGNSAFHSCTSLESITWNTLLKEIDTCAFYHCAALKEVVLPSTVTYIGEASFSRCESLTSVTIPEGVTALPSQAFMDCADLKSFDCGSHVASIGEYAFSGCESLESIAVGGVKRFGNYAFQGCTALTSLSIDSDVESIGEGLLFTASNVSEITVGEGNSRYSTATGALVDTLAGRLMYMPPKSTAEIYVIESGITAISDYAFNNCASLQKVVLPEGLLSIGSYAFNLCDSLTHVVRAATPETENCDFPETVTYIGGNAFYLTAFKSNLPQGFTIVGDGVLIDFKAYVDITYGSDNKTPIKHYKDGPGAEVVYRVVAEGAGNTKKALGVAVMVPEGVKQISSAFAYSDDVVSVKLPSTVSTLSDYGFYHSIALEAIDMSLTSITHLPDSCFGENTLLTDIVFPPNVQTVGELVFAKNAALKEVVLPLTLTEIGHSMFFV